MNHRHRRLYRAERTDPATNWEPISDQELEVELRRLQEGQLPSIPEGRLDAAIDHDLAVLAWLDGEGEFPT